MGPQIFTYTVISSFPLLAPITLSAMIILGHMSLKVFDLIIAVAGKQLQLDVPAIYMWQTTFDGLFFARGASIGILCCC
jgi:glucose/mannose transport system permease protein